MKAILITAQLNVEIFYLIFIFFFIHCEKPVTHHLAFSALSWRSRFPVAPCVCGADAPSAVKGTPDVWKKCAGVRRQLLTRRPRERTCERQLRPKQEEGGEERRGLGVRLWSDLLLGSRQTGLAELSHLWDTHTPPTNLPPKQAHGDLSKCQTFYSLYFRTSSCARKCLSFTTAAISGATCVCWSFNP